MSATVVGKGARRAAFTLIEMVVVLLILAIVAGLVVPVVGWLRRSANYASASNVQSTVMANFELYRTTYGNNNYPDRPDSLLTAANAVPSYVDAELTAMITPQAPNADQFACLNNSNKGIATIMRHVDPITSAVVQGNPGNTGITAEPFDVADQLAFLNPASTGGLRIVAQLYPDGLPTDVNLVLLGVGPSNTAIGRTMQSVPFDTNVDTSTVYNRFIGVYAVYSPRNGRRAQLKAVLCPRGRLLNSNLSEYYQSTTPE